MWAEPRRLEGSAAFRTLHAPRGMADNVEEPTRAELAALAQAVIDDLSPRGERPRYDAYEAALAAAMEVLLTGKADHNELMRPPSPPEPEAPTSTPLPGVHVWVKKPPPRPIWIKKPERKTAF